MSVELTQPPGTLTKTPIERGWIEQLARIVNALVLSGTTAQRPITFLFPFRPYGDKTLGIPIWRNADNTAWINSAGTVV